MFTNLDSDSNLRANDQPQEDTSFSNEISTSTLVKLLVRKGLLSPAEILEEERTTRLRILENQNKIQQKLRVHHLKRSRMKRWAAKHRWARRLTSALFGWEWKKVRHYHYIHQYPQPVNSEN